MDFFEFAAYAFDRLLDIRTMAAGCFVAFGSVLVIGIAQGNIFYASSGAGFLFSGCFLTIAYLVGKKITQSEYAEEEDEESEEKEVEAGHSSTSKKVLGSLPPKNPPPPPKVSPQKPKSWMEVS